MSLLTAAQSAMFNIAQVYGGAGTLKSAAESWASSLVSHFDVDSENERTVTNWAVIWAETANRLPSVKGDETPYHMTILIPLLYQSCMAGYQAEQEGRITVAQATDLETDYNTIW